MMYLGSQFIIGNLAPYVVSYFPECDKSDSQTLLPVLQVTSMISNFIGSNLLQKQILHPRLHLLIGGTIGLAGMYLASTVKDFELFKYVFMISFGWVNGFTYMVCVYVAW